MTAQISFMKVAVRNRIRSEVLPQITIVNSGGTASNAATSGGCELTDDGRPTVPYQGIIFFGVHSGKRRVANAVPGAYYLDEYYDFKVTLSMKSANKPRYRFGDLVIDDLDSGLQYLADLVIVAINGYLSLAEEANELLLAQLPSHQPFITGEVPIFQGSDDPRERGGEWFNASLDQRKAQSIQQVSTPMGMSLELRFSGLHLTRPIGQA